LDTRRLISFIKIVDTGSVSRAADLLNIAQPALSQQLAALEAYFKQKLVLRGQQGVTPTEAGRALYRHAQSIVRQVEHARADITRFGRELSGSVSVGLSPFASGSTLSLALLRTVQERHPGILLHINQSFGEVYSELIMTGRLEVAIIHGAGPLKGVHYVPLMVETFFLVVAESMQLPATDGAVPVQALTDVPMLLPPRYNFVRKAVELAFTRSRSNLRLAAEIESIDALREAVAAGLGATILPWTIANQIVVPGRSMIQPISSPAIEDTVSLCTSDYLPLSGPAEAVHEILLELARGAVTTSAWPGVRPAA
jgi:LysR family transcriptional regulator, nitrogen assimilation regulatory protein